MIDQQILQYKIVAKIGEGGMGVVYKAEDTKLNRPVALKFLSEQQSIGEDERTRFRIEAQAAAALDHPNICTVYDINESDGQTFIAMAYVEGQSLEAKIGKGDAAAPIPLKDALNYAIQIAEGIQAAHDKDIIHRDIKPANILVSGGGQVRITDFGLAKFSSRTQLTKEGTSMGTIAYMSPEQSQSGAVDCRSDIWALGVVLYEMITGLKPFAGDYEQAVVYSIINEDPPGPTTLRSGLPMQLENVIMKAMRKKPEERYQHAGDLLVDLKAVREGLVDGKQSAAVMTDSVMDSVTEKATSRTSSPRGAWAAGALAVLAIIALMVSIWAGRESDEGPARIAVLPFENLGPAEDEYFADGMTDEIISRLTSVGDLGVISRTSSMQYKGTSKNIAQIGDELGASRILEGSVRWAKGTGNASRLKISPRLIRVADDIQIWSQSYDQIINDVFKVQSEIAGNVIQALGVALQAGQETVLTPTQNLEAYQAYLRGRDYADQAAYAVETRRLEIDMYQRAVDLDPTFALAYAELGRAHAGMVNLGMDRSPERLALAKTAVDRALALAPDSPEAHLALAYYHYWGYRNYDRALAALEEARQRKPSEAQVMELSAWILRRQVGQAQKAVEHLEQLFALSPRDARLARELANTYGFVGRYEDSIAMYDRSIALAPDQSAAYVLKGITYWWFGGDLRQARLCLEAMPQRDGMLATLFGALQENHEGKHETALERLSNAPYDIYETPDRVDLRETLQAHLYSLMGQKDKAGLLFESARRILEEKLQKRYDDHRIHLALARVHAGLGNATEAVAYAQRATELYSIAKDAFHGTSHQYMLAWIHAQVGQTEEAVDILERLEQIPSLGSVWLLRLDRRLTELHSHPRFQALLNQKKYGRD